jgi:transcriptional/translational regulatory protein YebC/TACO1
VGEVRHAFAKHGGNLGQDGSVAFLFKKNGVLNYPPGTSEDKIMEAALEAGADDRFRQGRLDRVLTAPEAFHAVVEAMGKRGLKPEHADSAARLDLRAGERRGREKSIGLLDALEDLEDVQNVFSNVDLPEELLKLAS